MSFIYSNPNPKGKKVGDCVVRAISICMDKDWEEAYSDVCFQGLIDAGMPSENAVWGNIACHYDRWCDYTLFTDDCNTCRR